MKLRTGLLFGAAFAAGVAAGPVAGVLERDFGMSFLPAAFAQDGGRTETYRLLTLFGDVFERVRAEYVEPINDRDAIENAINGMLSGLDPHSSYMNAKQFRDMQVQTRGEYGGIGTEVTQEGGYIRIISPIDDTPAMRAGVKAGDLIVAIDGKTVLGLSLNEAVEKIRGPANSKVTLTIKRSGVDQPVELSMVREILKIQVVKSRLENDIGYIRVTSFTEQTDSGLRRAIAALKQQAGDKLRGFVIDLRNNPGGLLDQAIAVSDDFLDKGEIVSTRARRGEDSQRWSAKDGDLAAGLPIVILVNGGSASASEIVAGALQDHRRAVIVGTRSFGKGSVQTVMPLPGNGAMRLTTARYYTPSGRSIQGLGITPDVEVQSTRNEPPHFGPEREADLKGALSNSGGTQPPANQPRTDLPPMVKDIQKLPPENWPAFDAAKPETDYPLQQALAVVRAMPLGKRAAR